MKVMVIVKATASSEAGELPSEKLLADMGRYNQELVDAGIMFAGEGLRPSSAGARVHFSGSKRTVIDGPFAETKELIAGFWLWRVKSLAEAIEWVKRCPNPMNEDSDIEIRPIFEAEDFGEAYTPELREQEARIRAQTLGLAPPRFETSDALHVVGIKRSYDAQTRSGIPQQWELFAPHLGKIPGQQGADSFGVCCNATADCRFDYLTGVAVGPSAEQAASMPDGFSVETLPPRRYAVFSHAGHVSEIPSALDTIWSRWVPDCELKIASSPCFERYTADFDPQSGRGGIEFWIPLAE